MSDWRQADPLSEALAVVASQVKELRERLDQVEGCVTVGAGDHDSLRSVIEIDYQI